MRLSRGHWESRLNGLRPGAAVCPNGGSGPLFPGLGDGASTGRRDLCASDWRRMSFARSPPHGGASGFANSSGCVCRGTGERGGGRPPLLGRLRTVTGRTGGLKRLLGLGKVPRYLPQRGREGPLLCGSYAALRWIGRYSRLPDTKLGSDWKDDYPSLIMKRGLGSQTPSPVAKRESR